MSKKFSRNGNGEGTLYHTIQKIDRKNKRLDFICDICKNCSNRSICNNRIGTKKCKKCSECTLCLKHGFCDRFYCYEKYQAQITLDDGTRTTIANDKKRSETIEKKKLVEAKLMTKEYVKKNGITLPQKIRKILMNKFESNITIENTLKKDLSTLKYIENSDFANIPLQKVSSQLIQSFLNEKTHLSQSIIKCIYTQLKMAFDQAVLDKEIYIADNPMNTVVIPYSDTIPKQVTAFEEDEEKILLNYILNKKLVKSEKSAYDNHTIQTILLIALFTGMRIGEIGALSYDKHLDFENNNFIVERTLTYDLKSNVVIKDTTKTGKKAAGYLPRREIPFDLFCDIKFIKKQLKEQIFVARCYPKNKNNLLFCRKDGNCIDHKQITNLFKRICRDSRIKLDYETGCHIHMCRHTFATRCIESGMDLLYIAQLMGHTSTKQLQRTYGHLLDKYKAEQISLSKKYFQKNKLIL